MDDSSECNRAREARSFSNNGQRLAPGFFAQSTIGRIASPEAFLILMRNFVEPYLDYDFVMLERRVYDPRPYSLFGIKPRIYRLVYVVDLDQAHTGAAILSGQDGREGAGWQRSKDTRFVRVLERESTGG